MMHGISTTRLSVSADVPGWLSKLIRAWSRGLALTCFLLVVCAVDGASRSASAEQKPPSKGVAAAKTQAAPATAASAAETAADKQFLARRRLAIALMLERSLAYRTAFDVKLFDAKLAGPIWRQAKDSFLSSETHPELIYCVQAKMDLVGIPYPVKPAFIRVWQTPNGQSERLQVILLARGWQPCPESEFRPFPELEQARAKRRAALGKTD